MINKTEQKNRLDWIDILKCWGMFAIAWGHTLNAGAVRQYLYSFHVPLFFFVIGLFFVLPKHSFLKFTRKKAVSLLVPYFLFAIISILIFSVLGSVAASAIGTDISNHSLAGDLFEMLTGKCRANRPLWFLPCLFVFYIFCFVLTRFLEKKSVSTQYFIGLLVIVLSILLCFINNSVFKIGALFWKIDVAFFMLAFFAIALLAKPVFFRPYKKWVCVLLAFLFLLIGGAIAFSNTTVIYLSNNYGNVFIFYLSSICTIVGYCFLSIAISQCNLEFINKVQVYVGQRTLPILLMHKFPILFFQAVFPWTKAPLKNNNALVGLTVAIFSIASCLAVDILLKKILTLLVKPKQR